MDSPLSPTTGRHRRARSSCRRIDRLCCSILTYFPLLFVCGTTTWAVYTYSWSICWNNIEGPGGTLLALLGLTLYLLANWSYLTAVFTNPGSPLDNKHTYTSLPTTDTATISVKSSGGTRFCKKCQCYKPDRTHHCSSCRTCVLKMDHHCPWLANCLGLYNYKSFLLFLIYTSLFCLLSFLVSSLHVYHELFTSTPSSFDSDDFTPVNWVLLCVISGIIGLVLSGFTIWHLTLVGAGMTTIESLEKARYTTPSLSHRPPVPPGATRLYDNAVNDPGFDYDSEIAAERDREVRRYNAYVIEESAKRLPHPFDLGRRRNFRAVFGGVEVWWVWFVPVFPGMGDGWVWETSSEWRVAVEKVRVERERLGVEQGDREEAAGWGRQWDSGRGQNKAERILGKVPGSYSDGESVPLKRMGADSDSEDEVDDGPMDLEAGLALGRKTKMEARSAGSAGWSNWGRDADRW